MTASGVRSGTRATAKRELPRLGLPSALTAAQAARPALLGERRLTYAELDADVVALAGGLVGVGLHHGDRVAIWTRKSVRYVEAILATLGAGGAYVPLDGDQPPVRVAAILRDAAPTVLVTDAERMTSLRGQLPASLRAVVLSDGALSGRDGGTPAYGWEDFLAGAGPYEPAPSTMDDLAAILYTSGSTGVPKGVQISHRNLRSFVGWAVGEFAVGQRDVFANHASFNFDLSTFDLFVALSVGAAVWIVPREHSRDVTALAAGIREHGVTVLYCVPSVLRLLVGSGALTSDVAAGLRYVLFAGEVYPTAQVRALASRLAPACGLYNLYGPTETNVCTWHRVRPEDLVGDDPLPIGLPVTGARTVVTGSGGDGIGELVIEGDCVTPGYWGRDAESVVAGHPYGRHATGDLVSRRDGRLVYRGRKDRMVKLSGYRVELGEIETASLRHPGIAEVAAVVRDTAAGPRLTLFYTPAAGSRPLTLLDVKRHCAQHLPAYMVPHAAVALPELPRNANGKTDYRRLADGTGPDAGRRGCSATEAT